MISIILMYHKKHMPELAAGDFANIERIISIFLDKSIFNCEDQLDECIVL
jgi:hypothetical protein